MDRSHLAGETEISPAGPRIILTRNTPAGARVFFTNWVPEVTFGMTYNLVVDFGRAQEERITAICEGFDGRDLKWRLV